MHRLPLNCRSQVSDVVAFPLVTAQLNISFGFIFFSSCRRASCRSIVASRGHCRLLWPCEHFNCRICRSHFALHEPIGDGPTTIRPIDAFARINHIGFGVCHTCARHPSSRSTSSDCHRSSVAGDRNFLPWKRSRHPRRATVRGQASSVPWHGHCVIHRWHHLLHFIPRLFGASMLCRPATTALTCRTANTFECRQWHAKWSDVSGQRQQLHTVANLSQWTRTQRPLPLLEPNSFFFLFFCIKINNYS